MEAVQESKDLSLAERIRLRQKSLEEVRSKYEKVWDEICDLVNIRRENLDEEGGKIGTKSYSGYPVIAWGRLVSGFQGHLVSRNLTWFQFKFTNEELKSHKVGKVWLADCTQYFYELFDNTNYYDAFNQYVEDASSIGTADLYTEENVSRFQPHFRVISPYEFYIAENVWNDVDTVHRVFELSAREAYKRWGDNLSKRVVDAAEKASTMDDKFTFIHAVFPNEDRVYSGAESKGTRGMPFTSVYIEEVADEEDVILSQSGFNQNPHKVWRWKKNLREWYGRSPAHNALVDLLRLNQMSYKMLQAAELAVNPPWMVPAIHRGQERHGPGGKNYYSQYDRERHEPLTTGINYPIGKDREDDIRRIIDKHFMVDFFLMLAQMEGRGQKTATEILEMQGEKAAVLGTAVGNLQSESLDPLFNRLWDMESEAGRLPPMPEELTEYVGKPIEVDYLGPLAQIQQKAFKTRGAVDSIRIAAPLAEMSPAALDYVNFDILIKEILEANGMPQRAIRSDEEVQALRQERGQRALQEEQRQKLLEALDKVPGLEKEIEPGSTLDKLLQSSGMLAGIAS